jgi:hypothetical protein
MQAARLPSAATNDRPSLAVLTDGRHLIVLGCAPGTLTQVVLDTRFKHFRL